MLVSVQEGTTRKGIYNLYVIYIFVCSASSRSLLEVNGWSIAVYLGPWMELRSASIFHNMHNHHISPTRKRCSVKIVLSTKGMMMKRRKWGLGVPKPIKNDRKCDNINSYALLVFKRDI